MLLGDFEIEIISGGRFWLDGGAMFGVIPKPLWKRCIEPDEKNRIEMDACCILIKTEKSNILIETGCGDKFSEKELEMFSFEPKATIETGLAKKGLSKEDIDIVILSHLHFDHAGGGTQYNTSGTAVPTFPNATYIAQQGEWEDAINNFGIMKSTYRKENLLPIKEAGQLRLVRGDECLLEGFQAIVTGGHTRHHMSILIGTGSEKILFASDLIPTRHHVRLPYIMAYDLFPYETMTQKKEILTKAEAEGWGMVWAHEPEWQMGRIIRDEKGNFIAERMSTD